VDGKDLLLVMVISLSACLGSISLLHEPYNTMVIKFVDIGFII
jgi:hypothetical protein